MQVIEILSEGYTQIWGRSKHGPVRKYRCTSGPKKGRTVSKPATCTSPIDQKKSASFKKTRRMRRAHQSFKRSITLKRPQHKRIVKINKGIKKRSR